MAHIDPWARIDVTTIEKHIKKVTEPIYRNDPFFAMLKKRGRMLYNQKGGKVFDWRVRFRQHTPTTAGDLTPVSTPRTNLWKKAELPWRAYQLGESWSKFEKLVSPDSAAETLVKWIGQVVPKLTESMRRFLQTEIYKDGHASGAECIHGFESWCSNSSTVTYSMAGSPNDSYAGLSTSLGNYGGSWTAAGTSGGDGWPNGQHANDSGDFEYCFFSPIVVDYTNTYWQAATKTWVNTWREALQYGTHYLQKLQSVKPDVYIVDSKMYQQAEQTLWDKERLLLDRGSELVKLGFNTLSVDGSELITAYGVPANVGYGVVFDKISMMSLQSDLFGFERDYDFTYSRDVAKVDAWLNMRIESPAYFVKLKAIS